MRSQCQETASSFCCRFVRTAAPSGFHQRLVLKRSCSYLSFRLFVAVHLDVR